MSKLKCPKCKSTKLVKAGRVWSGGKKKQRYLCNNCGYVTTEPKGGKK